MNIVGYSYFFITNNHIFCPKCYYSNNLLQFFRRKCFGQSLLNQSKSLSMFANIIQLRLVCKIVFEPTEPYTKSDSPWQTKDCPRMFKASCCLLSFPITVSLCMHGFTDVCHYAHNNIHNDRPKGRNKYSCLDVNTESLCHKCIAVNKPGIIRRKLPLFFPPLLKN